MIFEHGYLDLFEDSALKVFLPEGAHPASGSLAKILVFEVKLSFPKKYCNFRCLECY